MNILYFADVGFPLKRANGIEMFNTCHGLARRGHVVTLVVRHDSARPARDPFAFYGLPADPHLRIVRVVRTPHLKVTRALYLAGAMRRAIRARRSDVVFTRDLGVAALLLRMPHRFRPPVVDLVHGFAPGVAGEMGQSRRMLPVRRIQ